MSAITEGERLRQLVDEFFKGTPNPIERAARERMYQAFKARLIIELRVDGCANQGVVSGHLEDRA